MSPLWNTITLHINLDQPDSYVYLPHTPVTGTLVLHLEKDTSVPSVHLVFEGRITTQAKNKSDDIDVTHVEKLFTIAKTVFQGPFTLPGGSGRSHEWRFQFMFPERDQGGVGLRFRKRGRGIFRMGGLETQVLPPSCEASTISSASYVIDYRVNALIPKLFPVKTSKRLRFDPGREARIPRAVMKEGTRLIKHSYTVDDEGVLQPCSWKEKLRNFFSFLGATKTPEIQVIFTLRVPSSAVIGAPIALSLELRTNTRGKSIPEFEMRQLEAALKVETNCRVLDGSTEIDTSDTDTVPLSKTSGLQETLPLNGLIPLSEILPTSIPHALAPSFATCSLTRTYKVKLETIVCCLGKEFKVKMKVPNVVLLSSQMRPVVHQSRAESSVEVKSSLPTQFPPSYAPPGYEAGPSSERVEAEISSDRKEAQGHPGEEGLGPDC